jgi:hypothetical protein
MTQTTSSPVNDGACIYALTGGGRPRRTP